MDWIHLPYDRVQWCALVNMIMKLGVPWKAGNFMTSWASQKGLGLHGLSYVHYFILSWKLADQALLWSSSISDVKFLYHHLLSPW
jgi:hypothetical protein